jgi:hypothetical protein
MSIPPQLVADPANLSGNVLAARFVDLDIGRSERQRRHIICRTASIGGSVRSGIDLRLDDLLSRKRRGGNRTTRRRLRYRCPESNWQLDRGEDGVRREWPWCLDYHAMGA